MPREVVLVNPVGIAEIAHRLEELTGQPVRPNKVTLWRKAGTLPEPTCIIGGVPLWSWSDVEYHLRKVGKFPKTGTETQQELRMQDQRFREAYEQVAGGQ